MYKAVIILFLLLGCSFGAMSQIWPKEGSKLHYRIIGFTFPEKHGTNKYTIEIASGLYYDQDSFRRNIFDSITGTRNKIAGEVPAFCKQYTWRIKYKSGRLNETSSELYHFVTGSVPNIDSNLIRFRQIVHAKKYKDAFVFLDGTGVLYDMKGRPVWYLPNLPYIAESGSSIRDLKFTPWGTITYLHNDMPFEINYDGDTLWKAPFCNSGPGSINENYHHELTRLQNGHYMVLGTENAKWKWLPNDKTETEQDATQQILFGTIIEYNASGKIMWQWRSSEYFKGSDLYNKKDGNGMFQIGDVHENSFFFDEQRRAIYVSFKNIDRVIKVAYPEGKVLKEFGPKYKPGVSASINDLFCSQHSCRFSQNGYLYLFNNNLCHADEMPTIVIMQENSTKKYGMEKVWEYVCTTDQDKNGKKNYIFNKGGNVLELPDKSLFVSMCDMYSKVFIVSHEKEILWSALPEKWNAAEQKWENIPLYRASIVTGRQELEKLLWR